MKTILEYIWIGGNYELRSKTRVVDIDLRTALKLSDIPNWNYDGSSTVQADGHFSEIFLRPCAFYRCPFRKNDNSFLVMCSTFTPDGEATETNNRSNAVELFNRNLEEEPWYGIEQEYFLIDPSTNLPPGFDANKTQGQFYCSVGVNNAFGRVIADEHLDACLYSGLNISGLNAEVAPGQWEYQIGPCTGISSGDQVWVSRYILERVAEKHGYAINWHPKPLKGDWNGSGCHTNYSTKSMRETDGLDVIYQAMDKLAERHDEHMAVYGNFNDERLTGAHETSPYNKFNWGVANRGASVRVGNETVQNKKGYFEDRRPASNMDPYLVTSIIFETTVLL